MTANNEETIKAAYKEGKVIQYRKGKEEWKNLTFPVWAFDYFEYRVKPKTEEKKVAKAAAKNESEVATTENTVKETKKKTTTKKTAAKKTVRLNLKKALTDKT